jgi:FkbM family methyltransferase
MKTVQGLRTVLYRSVAYLHEKSGVLLGFNGSEFGKPTTEILLRHVAKPVVIDIGCNVGDFVSEILLVNKEAVLLCFDINPEYGAILHNAHPGANIQFFNLGLTDRSGFSTIVSKKNLDRKAHLNYDAQSNFQGDVEKVRISTLDEALSRLHVPRIDILKIDTEGFDFKVLLGSHETLQKTQIVIFEIMYRLLLNGNMPQEILEFLKAKGFHRFYRLTKHFGLRPIGAISPWQVSTQNIIASKVKLM